ncbi:MAG: H/ACA RNA-protein complex protein Gar1 [Thermoprotei archaeon ex4572_64]|nr:MAG: H/ACA RNA-protein complex protein Gar1 [Thermoprotei archaeon ex4572_64]
MLKSIGKVLHLSRDKKLVIKLSTIPPLYVPVYDYSLKRVGILYDVIGPVNAPYALVKPEKDILNNLEVILGKNIYVKIKDLEKGGFHAKTRR